MSDFKFKTLDDNDSLYDNSLMLFRDLKNRHSSIQHLWSHQTDILKQFHERELREQDIAIELPTGTGKTLIGLLIAEWRRIRFNEKVIYLCPTRQLAYQVGEKAVEYGIKSEVFVGKQSEYDQASFSNWQSSKIIGISNYSSIFNSNPRINNPDVIILDDAHSAENFIIDFWSIKIERKFNPELYRDVFNLFKDYLPEFFKFIIYAERPEHQQRKSVELLPGPYVADKQADLLDIINEYKKDDNLKYNWSRLKRNIQQLNIYFSWDEILLRPWIPPVLLHEPFNNSKLRLYMSATLGNSCDIERTVGIKKISKIPLPEGWEKQGIGRRLFIFPERNFVKNEFKEWLVDEIKKQNRILFINPNKYSFEEFGKFISLSSLEHKIYTANDIEESLDPFIEDDKAILSLTGRYDGIDLKDESCRFMVINDLPKALNLHENYLWANLNLRKVFINERIRTRLTQAAGRCTRHASDFCIIIMIGQELLDFCNDSLIRKSFHPELSAELSFGLDNSNIEEIENFTDLINVFNARDHVWNNAERDIIKRRSKEQVEITKFEEQLAKVLPLEIDYQYCFWREDYLTALEKATQITDLLTEPELSGWRGIWYYHAGCAAYLFGLQQQDDSYFKVAGEKIQKAAKTAKAITWLSKLSNELLHLSANKENKDRIFESSLNIAQHIIQLGFSGKNFNNFIDEFKEQIRADEAKKFNKGINKLGKLLGFNIIEHESDGSPDGIWWDEDFVFIFETKCNRNAERSIPMEDCRQAIAQSEWVVNKYPNLKTKKIYNIIITPRVTLNKTAALIADKLFYQNTDEIIKLSDKIVRVLSTIRNTMDGQDVDKIADEVANELTIVNIDPLSVSKMLLKTKLKSLPLAD